MEALAAKTVKQPAAASLAASPAAPAASSAAATPGGRPGAGPVGGRGGAASGALGVMRSGGGHSVYHPSPAASGASTGPTPSSTSLTHTGGGGVGSTPGYGPFGSMLANIDDFALPEPDQQLRLMPPAAGPFKQHISLYLSDRVAFACRFLEDERLGG
jgi:hypothetical protein